ncbi:MAG: efflux RND transporter permease subunit, partial [Cyclobacteriaceae bacterium]|nr:efflux RND transporter permease subunit [Cyclobacteriaceae bacterium]
MSQLSPFRIVLIVGFFCLLGLTVVPRLSVDYIPSVPERNFTISYRYPGKPPLVIEKEATSLIENHLSQLEELVSIRSVSSYGSGYIELAFLPNSDIAYKEVELTTLLRQVTRLLPKDVSYPTIRRRTEEDKEKQPLLIYEMRYTSTDARANEYLTGILLPQLSGLPSVERVTPHGNRQFALKAIYDPHRLAQLGLQIRDLATRIQETTGQKEIGLYEGAGTTTPIQYENIITTTRDLKNVILRDNITLGDVASIDLVADQVRSYQRINGKNAIFLSFYPHDGVNRLEVARQVKERIAELASTLPSFYEIALNYDDTEYLKSELDKTWLRAGLSLLVIALFILLGSSSWRYLTVLMVSILASLALVGGAAWLFHVQVHLYTLAGITISAGIIVDNTIILVDHLKKHRNLSILPAQLASALTTIASLLVIFALPEAYRRDLSDFVLIISLALGVSFFVSWWFSPALGQLLGIMDQKMRYRRGLFLKKRKKTRWFFRYEKLLSITAHYRRIVILVCLLGFGIPVFLLPSHWENQEWYNLSIGSDNYQENLRPYVNRTLGGSLRLFYQNVYENSSYRTPEKTRLYLTARLPYGHTLSQMNAIMRKAEEYLAGIPELEKFITRIHSPRYARITIEFTEATGNGSFPY